MTKLLHTADIHLDSPLRSLALKNEDLAAKVESATRSALKRIVEISMAEGVSAVLISGDLFDGAQRSAKTAAFLMEQMDKLGEAGIRVFLVKGNHDAENPVSGEITLPENVHTFDGRGGRQELPDTNVWIHGVSFSGKQCPDSLLGKFQQPVQGAVNIAMLHTSLSGSSGHDNYAPCSVVELSGMGFDYWALGHIHKRQVHSENPWIVMPGIPQGRGMDELGSKSVTLIDVEDGGIGVREVPTSTVEFLQLEIDLTGQENEDGIRSQVQSEIQSISGELESEDAVLRVILKGSTDVRWNLIRDRDVWIQLMENYAESTGRLWLEGMDLHLTDLEFEESDSTSVDELGRMMESIVEEEGFQLEAMEDLEDMLRILPPKLRAEIVPDEASRTKLIGELANEGAKYMYARLKGGRTNADQ